MGKLNEQSMQVIDRIVDRHRGRPGPVTRARPRP